jgi:hypothetical protein
MMNRLSAVVGTGLRGENDSLAGDVLYTTWEDDESRIWIIIQNEMNSKIQIEKICLTFYDQKGKPLKEQQEHCEQKCNLRPQETMEFGPYEYPPNSKVARVRYVKYSVE